MTDTKTAAESKTAYSWVVHYPSNGLLSEQIDFIERILEQGRREGAEAMCNELSDFLKGSRSLPDVVNEKETDNEMDSTNRSD